MFIEIENEIKSMGKAKKNGHKTLFPFTIGPQKNFHFTF
jgi:hypothetical protein